MLQTLQLLSFFVEFGKIFFFFVLEMEFSFFTNSDFLIPISLPFNAVDLRHFKL